MQIVKPRPVQAASIPGMLGMFQNVWLKAMKEAITIYFFMITLLKRFLLLSGGILIF